MEEGIRTAMTSAEELQIIREENHSLFDSGTKVFVALGDPTERASRNFRTFSGAFVFDLTRAGDGSIVALDQFGTSHSFNAPAGGAVVFVADDAGRRLADDAVALWTRAKLPAPRIVDADAHDAAELQNAIFGALMGDLHAELRQTAEDAVRLDRQVAALREQLEHYRLSLSELKTWAHLAGRLPLLAFERLPENSVWSLGEEPSGAQLLPFAGNLIRAVSIQLNNADFLSNGRLTARLRAREDDSVLESWTIERATDDEWVVLAVKKDIPYRYRYVDLELDWDGDSDEAPAVRLANVIGDEEALLRSGGGTAAHQMLAMRVWTGSGFDAGDYKRFVTYPGETEKFAEGRLSVNVQPDLLARAEAVATRSVASDWLRSESNHLHVQPAASGPSIAAVDLGWTSSVRGVSALLASPDAKAPRIAFSVVASEEELSEAALMEIAGGHRTERALAMLKWTVVEPGTSRPMILEFPKPRSKVRAHFITKVSDDAGGDAQAWFRNLKYIV